MRIENAARLHVADADVTGQMMKDAVLAILDSLLRFGQLSPERWRVLYIMALREKWEAGQCQDCGARRFSTDAPNYCVVCRAAFP